METPVPSQPPPPANAPDNSRQIQRNRPRRARGRGNNNASLSFRPASVAPDNTPSTNNDLPVDAASGSRGSGRRGRGRGRADHNRMVNGRQFGGQLTGSTTSTTEESTTAGLQADAAVFVPGQQVTPQTVRTAPKTKQRQQREPKRRAPKSQAPDIATRTHEDIDNGHYECPICTSEVLRNSKVWACHTCWTVFHLTCVKKWSANEGSSAARQQADHGEIPPPRQWRCPGCNLPKDELPKAYSCWCGKEQDPRPLAGLPPHSCGDTCSKERAKKCPHPCSLTCHAGPCPPCTHMGPTQVCFCGKHEVTNRCSDTNYETGWSCGEVCGETLGCGEHDCNHLCHEGICGACEERVPARCYCGQTEKDILCEDRGDEHQCHNTHDTEGAQSVTESWTGQFDCEQVCGHNFDCQLHQCESQCHPHGPEPQHCPRSPDVVDHCPCGKTELSNFTTEQRTSCEDPIPACSEPCSKPLPCGHPCSAICHSAACPSCSLVVDISCRCGRTVSKTVCHQGKEEPPYCMRTCRAALSCGRHACDERCCPGERKAIERSSTKRKQRPLNSAPRTVTDDFEAEHICTRQCDRLLKCGLHHDQDLCHRGPCGSCREAIFEELVCNCGKTVLQPPLPCGTKPPPCRFACNRPRPCGHPQVPHNCHMDDEACPKCPYLGPKNCMCEKQTLKNQPCHLKNVSCGMVCDRKLSCGSHNCLKACHRPEDGCEDASGVCKQPCAKEKKACGHPDLESLCHAPYPCSESKPCSSKIFITCECQAQKQEIKCGATKTGEGNGGKTLSCNEECARLERNRRLAVALNIDQASHVEAPNYIPYSTETLNMFAPHIKWAQEHEREFRVFATSPEEKRLRFKPMKAQQRAFIHALAEDFGLDSEGMDPEPHRHVMVWKTPRFVAPPNKTLAEALRIRQAQQSATASANVSDNEGGKTKASTMLKQSYNAFVISNPRFGLTVDELQAELKQLKGLESGITFDVDFLPIGDVILKAVKPNISAENLQRTLQNVKTEMVTTISLKGYGSPELCAIDNSLNVLKRESDNLGTDGWSKVAAKKAAPKTTLPNNGWTGSNAFSALSGSKVTFAKKKPEKPKPKKELVVDDWEAAEIVEEEKEKVASGASGDEDGYVSTGTTAKATDTQAAPEVVEPSAGEPAAGLPTASQDEQNLGLEPVAVGGDGRDWASAVQDELD